MSRPSAVLALIAIQVIMAVIAIPSGILLLLDPSGSAMGGQFILPHLTAAIPFIVDFTLVGLWLFLVYGLVPIILVAGLLRHKRWAWRSSVVLGALEICWIGAEVALFSDLGFNVMYVLIGGIGVATLAASLNPAVSRLFAAK
ncbi:MAG TPA: hypothetical protein VFE91_01765 [Nitrososphaerales archaeon]|nr:hypothetical protein [Nitrososphaerales archaeon]